MSKDDQIQALNRRNRKDRDDHAKTMAAKNEQLRALRESWELLDTFPNLEDFLRWLHKIRDAAGPLRSPTYQPGKSASTTTQPERYDEPDRKRLDQVNDDIKHWTEKLQKRLSPKGPLVDDEIPDVSKPRCYNPECPARLMPQAFDQEICFDCKVAFTEFRPYSSKRCWNRDCDQYGKTNQCQHSWQKMEES